LIFVIFQIIIIFNTPLVSWDESVYLGMGKFIYSNGTVGLFESFRPTMLPLLSGMGWKLGLNTVTFGRSLALIFSVANLVAFYFVSKQFFKKRMAMLASLLLAIMPTYFIYTTQVFTGIIASFFVLLAFYFYLKRKYYWMSVFAGIATITRFPAGMFFVLFLIFMIVKKEKLAVLTKSILCFLVFISPYFIINYLFGNGLLSPVLSALIHQNNYVFQQDFGFYIKEMIMQALFLIFTLPGIYYVIKNKKWDLLLLFLVPLIYFTYIVNKQARFMNLFLPFVILVAVYGFYELLKNLKKSKVNTFALLAFLLISMILSISVIVNDLKLDTSIEEFKIDFEGTILTTDPIFSAYNDNKFLPLYFDISSGNNALNFFEDDAELIIYSDVYPCEVYENSLECEQLKNKLEKNIFAKKLVKETIHYKFFK